ncbi:hypothetical protein ABMA46_10045 [Mesorhizobium sp. CN5-321]|uniref:hypothetical protein n=1 Tax=Mesorhizobium hunchu TaxID=3157708 RepID=UPI0032B7EEC9
MVDAPKRYSIFVPSGYAEISERSDGEWVRHDDHARLQEQLEAVTQSRNEYRELAHDRTKAWTAAEARAARLEAALRRISDMCPATQEMTVAHMMADEAEAALDVKEAG